MVTYLSFLAILITTLFPYDIWVEADWMQQIRSVSWEWGLIRSNIWRDIIANVVVFIPVGMGLTLTRLAKGGSAARALSGAALGGLLLTCFVENVQIFLVLRASSLNDIVANTVGAILGALLVIGIARSRWEKLSQLLPGQLSARGYALWLLVALGAALLAFDAGVGEARLAGWESNYHLSLGNEFEGGRPWMGSIRSLRLSTGTLTLTPDSLDLETVRHYDKALHFGKPDSLSDIFSSGERDWWRSAAPMARFLNLVQKNQQFSISLALRSDELRQSGPSRILTFSDGFDYRDLTIGQQGDALAIRLRTRLSGPTAVRPQMYLLGFFVPGQWQSLKIDYDRGGIRISGEKELRSVSFELSPTLSLAYRILPMDYSSLVINSRFNWLYPLFFAALFFFPVGVSLHLRQNGAKGSRWQTLAGVVLPAILFCLIAWGLNAGRLPIENWFFSILMTGFSRFYLGAPPQTAGERSPADAS